MKNLTSTTKIYILSTILIGLALVGWALMKLDLGNTGIYLLAVLGGVAQTLKVEGPNERTNYNIALFVYGLAFIAYGPATALFVVLISHLAEWVWHKYPWFIQSFNIGAHAIPVFLAGLVYEGISQGKQILDLNGFIGIVVAGLVFVFLNHYLVGLVVKLARGQSFAESGVFELLTLSLDFTVLTLGAVTAFAWVYNPFLAILNLPLLYPLYRALQIPALKRQTAKMETNN